MRFMRRLVRTLTRVFTLVGCVAIFALMALMVTDALVRKFGRPVPGGFETSLVLLLVVFYLAQPYSQKERTHVAVDIISLRLSARVQDALEVLGSLIGIVAFGLLTYLSMDKAIQATKAHEAWSGIVDYPVWPFRYLVPLGLGVFVLELLLTLLDALTRFRRGEGPGVLGPRGEVDELLLAGAVCGEDPDPCAPGSAAPSFEGGSHGA